MSHSAVGSRFCAMSRVLGAGLKSCLFALAAFVGLRTAEAAVSVSDFVRTRDGLCTAKVTADTAATDRAVFVAWGASDQGATLSAWGANVRSAAGYLSPGARQTRITLPVDALSAQVIRVFLVEDGCLSSFLQSDGSQYIETDVYPEARDTKVFIDFAMQDITTVQQRLFGNTGNLKMQAYINGSKGWSWSYSNDGNWTAATSPQTYATTDRTQVTLDGPGDNYKLVIAGVEKANYSLTGKITVTCTKKSNNPLLILANGKGLDKYGNLKLYATQITTSKGVSRNYLPCVKRGAAGLYETVTGTYCFDAVGTRPLFVGAPTNATPSDVSAAVTLPTATTTALGVGSEAHALGIGYEPTSSAREVWLCWDETDKGDTFSSWANNERLGVAAANSRFTQCAVPPSAVGAKAVRAFLVAAGGSYACTYIRGDRGHAVDTGIPASKDLALTIDLKLNNTEYTQQRAFGTDDNAFTFASYVNGSGYWAWGARDDSGNWANANVRPVDERTTLTLDSPNNLYKVEVGGKTVKSMSLGTARTKTGTITVALLGAKSKAGKFGNCAIAELYSAQLSTNGVVARNFSPCVTNGVAVLRDAVTGNYFGNAITTNNVTAFIPGGRTDSPAAVAATLADLTASRAGDVFADAKFWLRGMAVDKDGNGVVTNGEFRNALDGSYLTSTVYGANGKRMVYSNEFVRLPGRGVGRWMRTIYLPQTLTITNATANLGYVEPTTAVLSGILSGVSNHWTVLIRCRPDVFTTNGTTQANNSYQFLMGVAHNGNTKKGVEFGFRDTGDQRRLLCLAGGSDICGSWKPISGFATITNTCVDGTSWVDVALVADGQKLTAMLVPDCEKTGSGQGTTRRGVTQIGYQYVAMPISLAPNNNDLRVGGEDSASGKRVFPMGKNDNSIKSFRGSFQQIAFWDRSLSLEELFQAVGWPRTDLFRVGVDNASASEFAGEMPAGGLPADDEDWPLQDGLTAGQSLTVKSPLSDLYEANQAQVLRWKALPDSACGQLTATINGHVLGPEAVRADEWTQWYVPARFLLDGTNTVVFTRTDAGSGSLTPDVIACGGGFQVGKYDGLNSEFSIESAGLKDYYASSGNRRDIRRVLYTGASTSRTNFWTHVNVPAELAGKYKWRFKLKVAKDYGFPSGALTQLLGIDLNGREVFSQSVKNSSEISFLIPSEDLKAGENVFNFRNGHGNVKDAYIPLDAFSLEPRSPYGMMFLMR